jgi:DNA-binding NarL/FixJ family response regulator
MSDQSPIRILSVDDHPLLRQGIASIIGNQSDMLLVAEASSGMEGIRKFREHRPDVSLMDLRLPDVSGIEATIAIRNEFAEARIIIVTTFNQDVEIQRALKAGAYGYVLKTIPPQDLVETIRQVHAGRKHVTAEVAAHVAEYLCGKALTEREIEVLLHIACGHRNQHIAERLFISEHTVKGHIRHMMEKLGARDRTQVLSIAVRRGIIQL